ncbi:hypothetical protein C2S51_000002 [Perilla frutescens var. frutescens]|nr:hypothetical protein C2S51_000002 [Perilla frutescens var. frutescens]
MAVAFPSYLDALVEGFPPAFKANSVPHHEYIEDSQNVGEFLEKLFGRLSVLLFHIDKQINKVLIQGRLLPRKLNQWAVEARAMKCQVSDLLKGQQNRKVDSLTCEEWVEIGVKMINHLKKCPFKDEMMYNKPIPIVIQNPESSSEKPSRALEEKYKVQEKLETEQSFSSLRGHGVRRDQDAGTSPAISLPAVELQKENVVATSVEKLGSEPISISESMPGTEILKKESFDMLDAVVSKTSANSSSISGYQSKQQFADEITEEGFTPEDSETEMFRNISSGSGFAPTSSNAERGKHHEESIPVPDPLSFKEEELYLVVVEDNHLKLTLDNQITLIDNFPSPAPPDSSPVNAMLNLVERDLRELPEKPNYPNSLLLFLQRNKRLTLIHPSFFNSMPDLRFLDMSDTKIRILPSSLFNLSKLKVLLLRNCVCLENLPPEIGKLNHMEALDLSGTELYDLPDEIGRLGLLRSMHLSFYGPDNESEYIHLPSQLVSPRFLSELKEIQALTISVHPDDHRWTEIAACIIKDISKLEMLSYLQFYFPEVEMFEIFIQTSHSWEKQKVSKFGFIVGQNVKRIVSRVPSEVESLFNQQERCLRYVNGDNVSPLIKTVLIRVTAFYLDHHTDVQSLSEFDISNFQALKFCVVSECPKIQAILDEKNVASAFPCLEYLGIYFLWALKHIWKVPSPAGKLKRMFKTPRPSSNFKALRHLIISTCPMLQFILWESMLQCLTNLEELVVEDCERVETIVKKEKPRVKYVDNVLRSLKKLVLHYLPELVTLGDGVCLSEEIISVYGCPKLILNSQPLRHPSSEASFFQVEE